MNINIHIGINQGTININSVEFTGNTSESAESTSNKGYEENTVVWEQTKEEDITPAYTPAYENVGKSGVTPQKGNVVVEDKKINNNGFLPPSKTGAVAKEKIVVEKQRKNENVSGKRKNVDKNRENVDKSEKDVDADGEDGVVHQREAEEIAQQILEEIKEIYTPKKKDSVFLSKIYIELYNRYERGQGGSYYVNKSERMYCCGSFLAYEVNERGEKKLIKANTCHVRLCPMCMWRRSLKAYREMRIVYDYVQRKTENSKFLLLTLTQKNVEAAELGQELDKILYGFNKLTKRKEIKKFCLGFVRSLEITYNKKTNTYHPHIHILIHTTEGLYSGRNYLSKQDYIKLWCEILDLEYAPNIDIRRFKPKDKNKIGKELAEICKYSVKPSDYIYIDDENLTKKVTEVLDRDLAGRRLLSYGGTIRKARKKLLFSDDIDENDDIMAVEDVQADEQGYIELYKWHFGEERYKRLNGEERESMLKFVKKKV
jgi:plasmid rolling circle replication initiator protein Rep